MCEPLRGKKKNPLDEFNVDIPDDIPEDKLCFFDVEDVKSAVKFYINYLEKQVEKFSRLHEHTKNDERYLMAITVTYEHLNKLKECFGDVIE